MYVWKGQVVKLTTFPLSLIHSSVQGACPSSWCYHTSKCIQPRLVAGHLWWETSWIGRRPALYSSIGRLACLAYLLENTLCNSCKFLFKVRVCLSISQCWYHSMQVDVLTVMCPTFFCFLDLLLCLLLHKCIHYLKGSITSVCLICYIWKSNWLHLCVSCICHACCCYRSIMTGLHSTQSSL